MEEPGTITRDEYLSRLAQLEPSALASIVELRGAYLGITPAAAPPSGADRDEAAGILGGIHRPHVNFVAGFPQCFDKRDIHSPMRVAIQATA